MNYSLWPCSEVPRWSASYFKSIFNESLATSVVPTYFKKSIIIPVSKKKNPSCLNEYRPVALTSIFMNIFERLVKNHICCSIPVTFDPLQFAYRPNSSPSWELRTASPRGCYGERRQRDSCLKIHM